MDELKELPRVVKYSSNRVLFIDASIQVEYTRGKLLFVDRTTNCTICTVRLYDSMLYSTLALLKVVERLLRLEPRCVIRIEQDSFLVSCKGCLKRVRLPDGKVEIDHRYALGTQNPLHFCKYERQGKLEIVYGDYGGKDEEGRVALYRRRDDNWTVFATFPAGAIDHIHRVEYDFYRDCYWVFTGDSDEASGIWKVSVADGRIEPYLTGKQKYRACVAFIKDKSLLFATDTPLETNSIYEVDLETKLIRKVCDIPGPCIYGYRAQSSDGDVYCFATSVEPDSRMRTWHYRTTYCLGPGVKDRYSYIIGLKSNGSNAVLHKAKKDWLPIWLFQFGNHRFPEQSSSGVVFTCPQSCSRWYKGTLLVDIEKCFDAVQ